METVPITDRPVLFLDSGVGGIFYCRHFLLRNPNEYTIYLADREHFPYGSRDRQEIAAIVTSIVERTVQIFNPKIVVLACNTASLAALSLLRDRFPELPFVGTVPAVKPAVLASKTGKIGVLGTELTIKEPYIRELAGRYGSCEITGIAAPELVEFVETRLGSSSEEEKKAIVQDYLDRFRADGVDAIVLGCTHFLSLLDNFREEAAPGITVFESSDGITQRIESLLLEDRLQKQGSGETAKKDPLQNLLLLTGKAPPEQSWINLAGDLGFSISLLDPPAEK